MGGMSRTKGKSGEREAAALIRDLTGWDVKRKVRQLEGESDLEGVPGWSVEVKRYAKASRALIQGWWEQAVSQAATAGLKPVLFWRQDRDHWRAVWSVEPGSGLYLSYVHTVEGDLEAWAYVARESLGIDNAGN